MKNPLYLVLTLLIAIALATCSLDKDRGNDDDGDDPPTFDQRLVGGKWYEIKTADGMKYDLIYNHTDGSHSSFSADCYYEFTKIGDKFYFSSDSQRIKDIVYQQDGLEGDPLDVLVEDMEVYSKDGVVYWKHNDKKLMAYEFHNQFPWPDSQWLLVLWLQRSSFNAVAANGGLITYLLYIHDTPITNTGIDGWRYLLRARNLELN